MSEGVRAICTIVILLAMSHFIHNNFNVTSGLAMTWSCSIVMGVGDVMIAIETWPNRYERFLFLPCFLHPPAVVMVVLCSQGVPFMDSETILGSIYVCYAVLGITSIAWVEYFRVNVLPVLPVPLPTLIIGVEESDSFYTTEEEIF